MKWAGAAVFGAGFLAGTAGIKLFTCKGAKKTYAHMTAAVLRAKDGIQAGCTTLKENCDDIAADAREINEKRAAKAEAEEKEKIIADTADAVAADAE